MGAFFSNPVIVFSYNPQVLRRCFPAVVAAWRGTFREHSGPCPGYGQLSSALLSLGPNPKDYAWVSEPGTHMPLTPHKEDKQRVKMGSWGLLHWSYLHLAISFSFSVLIALRSQKCPPKWIWERSSNLIKQTTLGGRLRCIPDVDWCVYATGNISKNDKNPENSTVKRSECKAFTYLMWNFKKWTKSGSKHLVFKFVFTRLKQLVDVMFLKALRVCTYI